MHGRGAPASAARAVQWYRRAIGAKGGAWADDDDYGGGGAVGGGGGAREGRAELEEEGERLPGGDASEAEVLRALARLYRDGGSDLPADGAMAGQFEYLARSSLRRDQAGPEGEGDGSDEDETVA